MGVPTSEVGYTPATSRREDHEVHKGHVVALGEKKKKTLFPLKMCRLFSDTFDVLHYMKKRCEDPTE